MSVDVEALAKRLRQAVADRRPIEALTEEHPDLDLATAYEVQRRLRADALAAGDHLAGYKLGLTSRAKQEQMNVAEPLYGWLTGSMAVDVGAPLPLDELVQPRAEPEIAFVLGRDLSGPAVTAREVLAATEAVTAAVEVLDSRYRDYRFTLPDVVADNASGGRYVLGGTLVNPSGVDLRLVGVVFEHNGQLQATAAGAAALGHPAAAVAWLARALHARGEGLRAGHVVLSGSLAPAVAVAAGDVVSARIDRLGTAEVAFV